MAAGARARVLLALAAAGVAAPALGGEFVLDDSPAVLDSECVTGSFQAGLIVARNFWCQAPGLETLDTWRPWVVGVWNVLWDVGAGEPWIFHLLGLLLHVACTLQLAGLARDLGVSERGAVAGAALFAVAPIHMDAVASVVGAADVWATLFVLLTLRAHLRGSLLTVAWATLALVSKESGVVIVPALAALSWIGPRRAGATSSDRPWLRVAGAAAATVVVLGARTLVLGSLFGTHVTRSVNPLVGEAWSARIPLAFDLLWRYLRLLALGHPLSADYSYAAVPAGSEVDWLGVALGAAIALGACAVLVKRWSDPLTRSCFVWFVAAFGTISNLAALLPAVFAERLFYGPSAPLLLWVGALVGARLDRVGARVALGLYLLLSAGLAGAHAWAWADEERLTAVTVAHAPDSARAHVWQARVLARNGDARGAETHARKAITIVPVWAEAHALLATSLDMQGQPEPALAEFRRAFELDPREGEVVDLFVQFLLRYGHRAQARMIYAAHVDARGGVAAPKVTRPPSP